MIGKKDIKEYAERPVGVPRNKYFYTNLEEKK
jgi:hypothetical protein